MLPPFPTLEDLKQSNDELGQDLLAFWIAYQAESKGIDPYNVPLDIQEKIVLATVGMDGDKLPELEKAIRRAAQEEYATAGAMLRDLVIDGASLINLRDEFITGTRRQMRNASKPRPDALTKFINECVERNPAIKIPQLRKEIINAVGCGVIEEITEDEIYFIDNGKGGNSATTSGLKDRLSKAKKNKINNSL